MDLILQVLRMPSLEKANVGLYKKNMKQNPTTNTFYQINVVLFQIDFISFVKL